ncbi:hypothetical protein O0L34_g13889 [Tuta absoluta]|nr:hypothetical protein O0L34_g13889 [Tuta absoluta]
MDVIQQKLRELKPPKEYTEFGSKVFALLNFIATTTLTGVTLYWFITKHYVMLFPFFFTFTSTSALIRPKLKYMFEAASDVFGNETFKEDQGELRIGVFGPFEIFVLWVALPLALTGFVFSIILVIAILKKKPHLVRAYFVFGVSTIIMCIMTSIYLASVFRLETRPKKYDIFICVSVVSYVIYSAILGMIWITYKNFKAENQLKHTLLINMNNDNQGPGGRI